MKWSPCIWDDVPKKHNASKFHCPPMMFKEEENNKEKLTLWLIIISHSSVHHSKKNFSDNYSITILLF